MSKGRIKAVLFIIVFLLVIAVAVNLLMDMQSDRKADTTPTSDPYANTVTPSVETQPALETAQPTPAIAPSTAPTATPAPATPVPTVTPTPTPVPTATPEPVQPVIPQGEVIGSGSFTSDTGTPLNLRADWTATVLDSERVEVTVNVYLISYQIEVRELYNAVNVSVGDQYASENSPAIKWENNTRLETLLASTVHTLSLPSGSSDSFPVAVQYQFGGTYSKVELPVIECGGTIELSR